MPVKVIFRGLILFRTGRVDNSEVVLEALMPDTRSRPKAGENGKHNDETDARLHYAGLLIPETEQVDITDAEVDFSPGSGSTYIKASDLKFPRIVRPKNKHGEPLIVDDQAPLAARINMRFNSKPTKVACEDAEEYYEFGSHKKLLLALVLTFDRELVVNVRRQSGTEEIPVPNNKTLYVYHADAENPDQDDLLKKKDPPPRKSEDIDFKWYYSLLEPTSDTFENWADKALPAPVYNPPQFGPSTPPIVFPSVSTCFPAWI